MSIIVLHGEDTFLTEEKLTRIKSGFSDLAVETIDAQEQNLHEFTVTCQKTTMFAEERLVVVGEALSIYDGAELQEVLAGLEPTVTVVLIEPKLDNRKSITKWLKQNAQMEVCEAMDAGQLVQWVNREVERLGGSIDRAAVMKLIERSGAQPAVIRSELEKLVCHDAAGRISSELVDQQTSNLSTGNIFTFMDALFTRKQTQAMIWLHRNLHSGMYPLMILSMVSKQLRTLIAVKDLTTAQRSSQDQIARQLGIHPFVAKKSMAQARQWDMPLLLKTHSYVCAVESSVKNGSIEDKQALEDLVVFMCSKGEVGLLRD